MQLIKYTPTSQTVWDQTVKACRNATFLFLRDFMDYHKDRFQDGSLIFADKKGNPLGLLPANLVPEEKWVCSHGGLTYGGLLLLPEVHLIDVKEMFQLLAQHYLEQGYHHLVYKPTPPIYHSYPCEEDRYWLFRADAQLSARTASSTIDLTHPLPFSTLRKRKIKKAAQEHYIYKVDAAWDAYWNILEEVLASRHQTHAVHRLEEMLRLKRAFPDAIRLHTLHDKQDACIAGCVCFDCFPTLHVQYIAAAEQGRDNGALDLLFQELIQHYSHTGHRYFDFGISTEEQGRKLNEGLNFQKEGFGSRTICYDTYSVDLEKLVNL